MHSEHLCTAAFTGDRGWCAGHASARVRLVSRWVQYSVGCTTSFAHLSHVYSLSSIDTECLCLCCAIGVVLALALRVKLRNPISIYAYKHWVDWSFDMGLVIP